MTITDEMIRTVLECRAKDDEGEFPPFYDLLDFSGENKKRTIARGVIVALAPLVLEEAAKLADQEKVYWMQQAGYRRDESGRWFRTAQDVPIDEHNRCVHHSNAALSIGGSIRSLAREFDE